jgi:hypothetical protein
MIDGSPRAASSTDDGSDALASMSRMTRTVAAPEPAGMHKPLALVMTSITDQFRLPDLRGHEPTQRPVVKLPGEAQTLVSTDASGNRSARY